MLSRRPTLPYRLSRLLLYKASRLRTQNFHTSKPHQNVLIDLSQQVFQNVHSLTGTSWLVSLPLAAFVFRLSFWPAQYYGLRLSQKRQAIAPLQSATSKVINGRTSEKAKRGEFKDRADMEKWQLTEIWRRTSLLRKNHQIGSFWKGLLAQLAFLPIWFVNIGVIQSMSGVKRASLLSLFVEPGTLPAAEPGFATGGFLWITDLTQADPTGILPATFGVVLYVSMLGSSPRTSEQNYHDSVRQLKQKVDRTSVLQYAGSILEDAKKYLAIFMAVILTQVPAAVVIFMCGSTMTQIGGTQILKRLAGVGKPLSVPVAQISKLKHKYRDVHSMDVWRKPKHLE